MAIVNATKTGNYSDITVWSTGALPQTGDTVRPLTYTVTVDQDVNIGSGIFEATGSGYFSVTAARTIVANILSSTGHSGGAVVRCTHTTGTVSITGNVTAGPNVGVSISSAGTLTITGNVTGGSSTSAHGVSISTGSGTINITGSVTGGSSTSCMGVNHNGSGVLTVVGNVTGGSGSSAHGLQSVAANTINVTGNVAGHSVSSGKGAYNSSTGTITITGNVTGGGTHSQAYGVENNSSGTVTITGEATGGAGAPGAVNSGSGTLRVGTAVGNDYGPSGGTSVSMAGLVGSNAAAAVTTYKKLKFGAHGQAPVSGCAYLEYSLTNNNATLYRDASTTLVLTDPAADVDLPATGDVRSGTVYASGNRTGTLAVPAANQVSAGVAVDNTTGTAVNTEAGIRSAVGLAYANLDTQLSGISSKTTNLPSSPAAVGSAMTLEDGAITAAKIASNAITDAKVASDVTIASVTGSVGSVTDGVTVATNNDKSGYSLSSGGIQAIWDALTSALTTVGSIGKRIADNLDAKVSEAGGGGGITILEAQQAAEDALAAYGAAIEVTSNSIKSKTDNLPSSPAATGDAMTLAAGAITAAVIATGAIDADAIATDAVAELQSGLATSSELTTVGNGVTAIKTKTDNLPISPAATGDAMTLVDGAITAAKIAADAITAAKIAADVTTEIQSGLATSSALSTVDGIVSAIKAKTDNLPADPADQSAVEAAISAATSGLSTLTTTDIDNRLTSYDAATGTEAAAIQSAISALPSASTIASAVWSAGGRTLTGFGTLIADIWSYLTASATTPGSIGKRIADNLDAQVSSGGGGGGITIEEAQQAAEDALTVYGAATSTDITTAIAGVTSDITAISAVNGSEITVYQLDTWRFTVTLTGVNLNNYEAVGFVAKRTESDTDDEAIVIVRSDDGLVRLAGAEGTGGDGTLTVNSATSFTVAIAATATTQDPTPTQPARNKARWWLKGFDSTPTPDEAITLATGNFVVKGAGLRATE